MSIRISNINKDNRFGGRNINVSTGSSHFRTPMSTATQKHYYSASSLPHRITIENPISEFVFDFNNSNLDAFLQGNGSMARRRKSLDQSVDMMRCYPIMSTIQVPNNRRVSDDELMLFLMLQRTQPIGIISIPPFEYDNIELFKNIIIDYSEKARQLKQEAMPIIHINQDTETFLKEFDAVRELHTNGLCNLIGFKYAPYMNFPRHYLEIYKHRDEDIWYHCFGIPRTPMGRKDDYVAHIHELQNWGLDTFSPIVRQLGKKQIVYMIMKSKSTSPSDLKCQRFDAPTLGIIKEDEWRTRYKHDLHCNCPVCKGHDLSSFKDEYSHEKNGDFNANLLRHADKIHELSSGLDEFNESMKSIQSDDLSSYFNKKEFTKGRIEPPNI